MNKKPLIIINFKTYKQGNDALKLAKAVERVDKNIIIGVQPELVNLISKNTKLKVFSEHADPQDPGRNTGFILADGLKAIGAKGVFLNHSEHRIDFDKIKKTVQKCKKIGLKTAIFAKDLFQAKKIKKLKPEFLIIEPPELVAGKVSVSQAKPEMIKDIKKNLKYPFIVGAGIKTNEDLLIALKLGATGIALSSAITLSKNPSKVLKKLIGI